MFLQIEMNISQNRINHYLFFAILIIYTIFNGGNSDLLIQINFLLVSFFFLYCCRDKNNKTNLKHIYLKNKLAISFYIIFLIFLIFQITPIPINYLKIFSPNKYEILSKLNEINSFQAISFAPTKTFFQILNFISLFLILLISKLIFKKTKHITRLYLFLSFLGSFSSFVAILFLLINNPDIYFIKNSSYYNASTGFFINRTNFSIFLLFTLLASFELLRLNLNHKNKKYKDHFFLKIYVRIFIIFITIGIITTFSRIGNFLLLVTIIYYLLNSFFIEKTKNKIFRNTILIIIFFDILILGYYFGADNLIERFYFIGAELNLTNEINETFSRFDIINFSFNQIKNYYLYGFGLGSYELVFKLNYLNNSNVYANHAHSDLIEFIGEIGIIGFTLFFLSIKNFFVIKNFKIIGNQLILFIMIFILLFDFSLHIPLIQVLFLIFLSLNLLNENLHRNN